MTRYLALIDDPAYLAPSSIYEEKDVMLIESVRQAREVLDDLYCRGFSYIPLRDLRNDLILPFLTPLSNEATLTLYRVADVSETPRRNWETLIENGSTYPDYQVRIGRNGGILLDRL